MSDAKKIASILRYLNDTSISSKKSSHIGFDLGAGGISWRSPEGDRSEIFRSLSAVKLPSKGAVREGQVIVFFGPLGAEEDIAVFLRDDKTEVRVVLSRVSGRVKIITGNE